MLQGAPSIISLSQNILCTVSCLRNSYLTSPCTKDSYFKSIWPRFSQCKTLPPTFHIPTHGMQDSYIKNHKRGIREHFSCSGHSKTIFKFFSSLLYYPADVMVLSPVLLYTLVAEEPLTPSVDPVNLGPSSKVSMSQAS